jgi:hypothetical protein
MIHGLLVNLITSALIGPAMAIATACGIGASSIASNASHAVWKEACSAVFIVTGSPSDTTLPPATSCQRKARMGAADIDRYEIDLTALASARLASPIRPVRLRRRWWRMIAKSSRPTPGATGGCLAGSRASHSAASTSASRLPRWRTGGQYRHRAPWPAGHRFNASGDT